MIWLLLAGCGPGLVPAVDVSEPPPDRLSAMGLVAWKDDHLVHADEVFVYELNTPLFTDFALKSRGIYIPSGAATPGGPVGVLDFPVGTHILKTFLLPPDLREPEVELAPIETRVLRRTAAGWEAWPYIWSNDRTDATLEVGGEVRTIDLIDPDGQPRTAAYLVPQRNQCGDCHAVVDDGGDVVLTPIGPKPRHLHRDGQLEAMLADGLVTDLDPTSVVPATDFDAAIAALDSLTGDALDAAARDYLDINCGHCHRPEGVQGVTSQLFLNVENDDDFHLGICKRPGSAGLGAGGLTYDIVPGDPDASILVYRMQTEEVGAMMPLVGRSLAHGDGVDLVRAWIAAMPPDDCE